MELERRVIDAEQAQVRVEAAGDGKKIVGYAAVFNSNSKPMKTDSGRVFVERIAPGAFANAIDKGDDTKATIQHDPNTILGRRSKGTLRLAEDQKGLRAEIIPPDTTLGNDTIKQVERGDLDKMSFAFRSAEDSWERCSDGTYTRTLKSVSGLSDVTLTDRPAYTATSVSLRMADEAITALEEKRAALKPAVDKVVDQFIDVVTAEKPSEKRFTFVIADKPAEKRFTSTVMQDDNSVIYACDCCLSQAQSLGRYLESLIRRIESVEGEPNDTDQRALDDLADELMDLRGKIKDAAIALEAAGAEEEPEEASVGEASYSDEEAKALRTKAEMGTLSMAEVDAIFAKIVK